MPYSYDRRAKAFDLSHHGLEGLPEGRPTKLYHGTTRSFTRFDLSRSRTELVDRFYGVGIFLTPSKHVAEDYAGANRNAGFDRSIIEDLKRKNPKAGAFLEQLVERGSDVWDDYTPETLGVEPGEAYQQAMYKAVGGIDPNTIMDVAQFVIGSKIRSNRDEGPVNIFNMSTGLPDWAYRDVESLGLDSDVYRPKVYTCVVTVKKTLITASKSAARSAPSKGYDSVIYYGSGLVGGVPEVAVYDSSSVKITGVDVI